MMRKIDYIAIAFIALLSASQAASPVPGASPAGADPRALKTGFPSSLDHGKLLAGIVTVEPIEREGLPGVGLAFTAGVTREEAWDILTDGSLITTLYPDCDEAIVHRSGPEGALIEYRLTILFKKYSYTLDLAYDREAFRITWREAGGDFKRIRGYWELRETERAGTCLILNETILDTGIKAPAKLESWVKRNKTRKIAADFREWVDARPISRLY